MSLIESPLLPTELNTSDENELSIEVTSSELATESENDNTLELKNTTTTKDCQLAYPSPSDSLILKVFMENQGVKSFKYDKNTCVRDVLNCLREKLDINFQDCYGLVVKLNDQNCVSSFVLL